MIRFLRSFLIFALALCLLPAQGLAQEVRVRSGEHGSYTRLAFDIPADTGWEVTQLAPDRVELRLDAGGLRIDTSSVFNRINTDRIAELDPLPQGTGLGIDLGCDCVAEAFLAEPTMLVIDIRPGRFEPPATTAETAPVSEEAPAQEAPLSGIRVGALPGIGPAPMRNPLLPVFVPQQTDAAPPAPPVQDQLAEMDPATLERTLAEQLATAATDGLLSPGLTPAPSRAANDGSANPSEQPLPGDDAPELSVQRGAIEAAILGRAPSDMQTRLRVGGTGCIPDAALDVASWGSDETFEKGIPDLRRKLYGEFDALNPDTLTQLVQAHIYIGFGAEARALLELDQAQRDPVLFALAGIVDGGADRARRLRRPDRLRGLGLALGAGRSVGAARGRRD